MATIALWHTLARSRGERASSAIKAQLGAVLPFAQWPSVNCLNNYADDLLVAPLAISGGYVQVPDAPGLGVTVDEAALMRYRMQPPYQHPAPRMIMSVTWPSGQVMHYFSMRPQCWADFLNGNQSAQDRGVRMDVHADDGTPEWNDLYERTLCGPVRG